MIVRFLVKQSSNACFGEIQIESTDSFPSCLPKWSLGDSAR